MERKSFAIKFQEVTMEGIFKGHSSIKSNVDLAKEQVMGGAFKKTISENPTVPILWQHDPEEPIGVTTSMIEDSKGLAIEGQLVLEVGRAREALALLKAGAIKGLSIGYDVIQHSWNNGVRQLKELKLYENSLVTFPMNPLAGVEHVKSARALLERELKEGRVLSTRNRDRIKQALDILHELHAETAPPADDPFAHELPAADQSYISTSEMAKMNDLIKELKSRVTSS